MTILGLAGPRLSSDGHGRASTLDFERNAESVENILLSGVVSYS